MDTENNGEDRVRTNAIRVAFLLLTCVFVLALLGFLWLARETHDLAEENVRLGKANRALILDNQRQDKADIANSIRLCRQNLEGVRQIFKPFFPPPPVTPEVQERLTKFNNRVDGLKRGCARQLNK